MHDALLANVVRAAPPGTPLAGVAFAALLGLRHAFEPDHVVAVATLVSRSRGAPAALRSGASWGLGHTTALFVLGTALAFAKRALPPKVGLWLEFAVAVMILGIGISTLLSALRRRGTPPVQTHEHRGTSHVHPLSTADVHSGTARFARGSFAVGLVHGLAGSGALTALAVSTLPTLFEQGLFVLLFGVGSTIGMAVAAGLAGAAIARLAKSYLALALVSGVTGASAVLFGMAWGYPLLMEMVGR